MNVYSFVSRWNRFELRFHVNAAKYIESIKEQDRDIRFARTQNSAISEHADETGIFPFGTKSSLLIVTLTGTHVGSRRLSI